MAKDYLKVEPDRTKLMQKHFTTGRGGRKIRYIVRHHTAGILTLDQVWQVWQSRQASAHYIIDPAGQVGQLVWDGNTAWANGNSVANQESITIEHSNSAGAGQDWPINDVTIKEGARWAAALCLFYNLGKPEFGKNIRDHREFSSTSCPYHLRHGGKYHWTYMAEAQRFYDELVARKNGTTPPPNPTPTTAPEDDMNPELRALLESIAWKQDLILDQLAGYGRDENGNHNFNGWPALGESPDPDKDGLTLVDGVAATRHDIAALGERLDHLDGGGTA